MDKSDQIVVNDIFGKRRNKRLNILFFVSASKTYSFALPLSIFFLISTALVGILIWSALSFSWLTKTKYTNAKLDMELRLLKSKLFEYQSRYEDVYGFEKKAVESRASVGPTSIRQLSAITEVEEVDATQLGTADQGAAQLHPSDGQPEGIVDNQGQSGQKITVDIKNVQLKMQNQNLILTFDMQNKGQTLQSGAVKAFVKAQTNAGEMVVLSSTGVLPLSVGGVVQGEGVYYRFNHFINKKLSFAVPADSELALTNLEIQAISSRCMSRWQEGLCNRSQDLERAGFALDAETVSIRNNSTIALKKFSLEQL